MLKFSQLVMGNGVYNLVVYTILWLIAAGQSCLHFSLFLGLLLPDVHSKGSQAVFQVVTPPLSWSFYCVVSFRKKKKKRKKNSTQGTFDERGRKMTREIIWDSNRRLRWDEQRSGHEKQRFIHQVSLHVSNVNKKQANET